MSNTTLPGWPYEESPFHRGERAIQKRVGVADKLEVVGRKVIRNLMPDQHREFFAQLPFVIIGSVDPKGQPRASVLVGHPGFIHSPDPRQLDIRARPLCADPLHETLRTGALLGLLGIEPHTRRRNRMNGTVQEMSADGFSMRVNRSFGNCPKYIQAREPRFTPDLEAVPLHRQVRRTSRLDEAMCQLVASADTFFIATSASDDSICPHGADVSHRGGKPGFVRLDDAQTLTVPNFVGNFLFNTLGNIVINPRAGLLFINYANGDLLYLATQAGIIWEGAEVEAFAGAQCLLRLHITDALLVENSLPLRWSDAQLSPTLKDTGDWDTVAGKPK